MKNKNILNKFVLGGLCVTAMLSISSCDPLGIEPTTMVDETRFWENAQLSRAYVNNFYFWAPAASGHNFQSEQWSDNCIGNYEQDWNTYRQTDFTHRRYDAESTASCFNWNDLWKNSYKNIRAINLGIEKIGTSNVLLESSKNQFLGECYFFRAWKYFDMQLYWGALPYVESSLTLEDETYIPRTNREVIFDNILADLDRAAEYFEAYGGKPEIGMVTLDAVQAFKSRVALYAACAAAASSKGLYSYDDKGSLFSFTKDDKHYYEIAYAAASKVIGKYTLEENYEDLFTKSDAHKSTESIWPVMFTKANRSGFNPTAINGPDDAYYGNTDKLALSWDFRSGLFPTQDLVDCYLQKDEADGKWKQWWKTRQAAEMGVTVDANGEISGKSVDYRKMYQDRDTRFYATVTYDGSYMAKADNQQEKYIIQTWIDNSDPAGENSYQYSALHTGYKYTIKMQAPTNRSSAQTITGYYSRKYSQFDSYKDDGSLEKEQRSTCYFNIRYAEVLLNYAEAAIKLNKAGAEGYINDIRHRAGLDNFDPSIAGHDLWEECKLQRRLEFAFECPGFRYYDLLRWSESEGKSTIDELNRPARGMHIFRKGIESKKAGENGYPAAPDYEGYFVPYFQTATLDDGYSYYDKKFDNARYYFVPFSQTMITSYTGLIQNPGWSDYKYNN